MGDLIRRQDAIDAVENCEPGEELFMIKSLPSAEPSSSFGRSSFVNGSANDGDTISRQAAIEAVRVMQTYKLSEGDDMLLVDQADVMTELMIMPSAEPEISRIEKELHGKTPEEQYEFLYWLMFKFARTDIDSRLAVVEWLRGEKGEEDDKQGSNRIPQEYD